MSDPGGTRRSKSQRKREALALQALGESLIALGESDLARIPMWPDLEAAVVDVRSLERTRTCDRAPPVPVPPHHTSSSGTSYPS